MQNIFITVLLWNGTESWLCFCSPLMCVSKFMHSSTSTTRHIHAWVRVVFSIKSLRKMYWNVHTYKMVEFYVVIYEDVSKRVHYKWDFHFPTFPCRNPIGAWARNVFFSSFQNIFFVFVYDGFSCHLLPEITLAWWTNVRRQGSLTRQMLV